MPADLSGNYSWTQADAAASAMTYDGSRGYLATVTSAAENAFLGSQFESSLEDSGNVAWIGLTDAGHTGDWTWVDGEPFSYSNWAVGEPNNPGVEDWVGYWNVETPAWSWNNFLLDDYAPGVLYGFIVEFNPPGALTTTTALRASSSNPVYGQPITLTATVSSSTGTPTGLVTFYDGSTDLGTQSLINGTATLVVSTLPVGTDSLTASYAANSQFSSSQSPALRAIVQQGGTSVAITSAPNPSVFGQVVAFTAVVNPLAPGEGGPTGTVKFEEGSTVLGSAHTHRRRGNLHDEYLAAWFVHDHGRVLRRRGFSGKYLGIREPNRPAAILE